MKILELKIKDSLGEEKNKIKFKEKGINYIFGDIQEPENKKATINSLGKTLLLKFIDYIFGANEDNKIIKEKIKGYTLEAVILVENKKIKVKRILGNSKEITVNDEIYSLSEYKKIFSINRSLYTKQIILSKKNNEISNRDKASEDDVLSVLKLLNLKDIVNNVKNIYTLQNNIKDLKKSKQNLLSLYSKSNTEEIDKEIFFIDKEVEKKEIELKKISNKIQKLEVSDIQKDTIKEYENQSQKLKKLQIKYEKNKIESERLHNFIEDSNKVDISTEHILKIYKKTEQEIPNMIKKKLEEVEKFHQKVYEERKEFLEDRVKKINDENKNLEIKIEEISENIDKIGFLISQNKIYQESIELFKKYNDDLNELKFKQGSFSKIKDLEEKINDKNKNLEINFEQTKDIRKNYDNVIKKYSDFIYDLVQKIYDENLGVYFDIKIREKHIKNRPVIFDFSLKGDGGEGINEVKKNLMDILIFKYNKILDFFLQDSSCFNGIDTRQISGLLKEIDKISNETGKQSIIAINKYQLDDEDIIKIVEKNSILTLSENNKLLGIDF